MRKKPAKSESWIGGITNTVTQRRSKGEHTKYNLCGYGRVVDGASRYEGWWKNGAMVGYGQAHEETHTTEGEFNGTIVSGTRVRSERVGWNQRTSAMIVCLPRSALWQTYTNGSVYRGKFLNNLPHGQGSFTRGTDSLRVEGEFVRGGIRYGKQYGSDDPVQYFGRSHSDSDT